MRSGRVLQIVSGRNKSFSKKPKQGRLCGVSEAWEGFNHQNKRELPLAFRKW